MYFSLRHYAAVVALLATSCVLPEQGGNAAKDTAPVVAPSGGAGSVAGGGTPSTAASTGGAREVGGASSEIGGAPTVTATTQATGGTTYIEPTAAGTGGTTEVVHTSTDLGGATSIGGTNADIGGTNAGIGGSSTETTFALFAVGGDGTGAGGRGMGGAESTGGACPGDASVGGSTAVAATSLSPCDGVTATCGERFYPVGGRCVQPIAVGYHNNSNAAQDGGLGYDRTKPSFRINRGPASILAYRLSNDLPASAMVVSLGAIADIDAQDPVVGGFRLALFDSDINGYPNQLVTETQQVLSANNPEECLSTPPILAGGSYWLLLRVPLDGVTIHLEATNVLANDAPGKGYYDSEIEPGWPSGIDWSARLTPIPPPPGSGSILATLPHIFLRYVPPE